MSDTLNENIYDNLQQNFTNKINMDTNNNNNNDNSDKVGDIDSEPEVVLRDRKDSVEIQTNRQRHKKHKSWNQRRLMDINAKYFENGLEIINNGDNESSDKENVRLSQKSKRSKSVGFVLKSEKNSDDSFETADEENCTDDEECGLDDIRNSFTAQVQNHYYTPRPTPTNASAPFDEYGQTTTIKPVKCIKNEKTFTPISSDEPESYSETETDDDFLPKKKKIGWNPPSPPPLPPLPPEINLPNCPPPPPHSKVDVSAYLQKKSLAQGMMDLALLSANANQLRYVLDSRHNHPYFVISLALISFSLFLQILVGLSLIWNSQYNIRKRPELKIADRLNNISVVGVFLITITNVFISTFGGSKNSQADDIFKLSNDENETDGNASMVDNLELI